jgi:clan AA aspartic protease (TIGR02281 family)
MTYPLKREPSSNLLIVSIEIDDIFELRMILDTGASHTTIDSNALHLLGYNFSDKVDIVEIETANGVIQTDVFAIDKFKCLGIEKNNFQIQVYDFLAHSIFSDYNGLLGLDFLEGLNFCINTNKSELTIS